MHARDGVQIPLVQNALSKQIPSRANRSIVGVGSSSLSKLAYAPTACEVWSSDMMKRMLGRRLSAIAILPDGQIKVTKINATNGETNAIFMI